MSKSLISTGINPNDGNGDTLLAGATKVNSNFNEIYSALGNGTDINIGVGKTVISTNALGNVGIGTTNSSQKLTVQGNISATGLLASSINLSGIGTIPTLRGTTLNYTTGNIVTGVVTSLSGSTLNYSGIVTGGSYRVGSNEVISSARQLRNIASIDSVTKATLESSIQLSPNNFTDLNVSGISTLTGNVSFGSSAFFGDNDKVNLGDSSDLQLYHDSANSFIHEVGTGSLNIRADGTGVNIQRVNGENLARFLSDSSVELYFDNSKKFETNTSGVSITGTTQSQQLNVTGVSTFAGITTVTGTTLFSRQLNVSGVSTLGITTFTNNVSFGTSAFFGDNDKVNLGDSSDLQIFHDGSDSYVHDVGTGSLNIRADGTGVNIQKVNGENLGRFLADGSVELYFDNSKKIETTTFGLSVIGTTQSQQLNVIGISTLGGNVSFGSSAFFGDNDKVNLGDSSDLQLYHDGSNSFIHEVGTGSLNIRADGTGVNIQKVGGENLGRFLADGTVELYFDNSKKFETTGAGVSVSGALQVSSNTLISGITTVGLAATSTPPSNSQLSFELTSNTNLRIKVRGTDGVLRSANITLA